MSNESMALICNQKGIIKDIIYNSLNLNLVEGELFKDYVDIGSKRKAEDLLEEIKEKDRAVDWELTLSPSQKKLLVLHFLGLRISEDIILVAAPSRREIIQVVNKVENVADLNLGKKKIRQELELLESRDSSLYDEISRLNNELTTAHRLLTKQNLELERLNKEKNHFLGMAAHDLRNPLSVILMYSDFIMEEADLKEEHIEFLEVIRSSSEFMLKLINNLLDVSKIESGELELELEPHNLVEVIQHNLELNQLMAEKKDIDIIFDYDKNMPPLMLDRAKIEQVLNNLISNAIKFSYPHSKVKVSVRRDFNQIIVSVKDKGQGIRADELPKLFKPFSKTSAQGTAGEKSTGLGLSISKRIVEEHGGKIWAESEERVGSTFFFSLDIDKLKGKY